MVLVSAVAEESNHEQNGARLCSSCSLIMGGQAGSASQKLDETLPGGQRAILNTEAGTSGKAARISPGLAPPRPARAWENHSEHEVSFLDQPAMSALPCPQLLSPVSGLPGSVLRPVAGFSCPATASGSSHR
jgi:hypothetical protein